MTTIRPVSDKNALLNALYDFHRSRGEEWANAISHIIGVLFGIAALVLMCVYAAGSGSALRVTSVAIYGAMLIILYASSALYHAFKDPKIKLVFQYFDHCSIFLLIAGTYTPIVLLAMSQAVGWTLFGIQWGLALIGILAVAILSPNHAGKITLPLYLIMGWMIAGFIPQLLRGVSGCGLSMLVAGGVTYSLGVIFFIMDNVPYMHFIWHLFVLGGSICHWILITFCLLPKH